MSVRIFISLKHYLFEGEKLLSNSVSPGQTAWVRNPAVWVLDVGTSVTSLVLRFIICQLGVRILFTSYSCYQD